MKLKCPLCENSFHYGHGRYEGKPLKIYGITICQLCYDMNHDGFAPHYEEIFAAEENDLEFLRT